MQAKITTYCCMCGDLHETNIELPDGWKINRYDAIDSENGFCPKHSIIAEFTDSQCPGCVGNWCDCSLWRSFAYQEYSLTESDLDSIRRGVCTKRVNGTFSVSNGKVQDIYLSSVATTMSGEALVDAIIEIRERDYKIK